MSVVALGGANSLGRMSWAPVSVEVAVSGMKAGTGALSSGATADMSAVGMSPTSALREVVLERGLAMELKASTEDRVTTNETNRRLNFDILQGFQYWSVRYRIQFGSRFR
mmetsp:Transcript_10558/g.26643  ORF Transcript_10558/g.26643 Transcript_10558/m.26643 type:complete len:110 (+) Transcript_10558:612-941(+)